MKRDSKRVSRFIISISLILIMIFNMVAPYITYDSVNSVSAASGTTLTNEQRWASKQQELGWFTFSTDASGNIVNPTKSSTELNNDTFWKDTSTISTNWINVYTESDEVENVDNSGEAKGTNTVVIATTGDAERVEDAETVVTTKVEVTSPTNDSGSLGMRITNAYSSDDTQDDTQDDTTLTPSLKGSDILASDSGYISTDDNRTVSDEAYSGLNDESVPTCDESKLYYTIEKDNALGQYYRQYYVSTADQLAVLLYNYEQSTKESVLKTSQSEINDALGVKTGTAAEKIGIVLLCDIDLGGSNSKSWVGYKNVYKDGNTTKYWYLEIDGQGHKIYNGYYGDDTCHFTGAGDTRFAIHDVVFSSHYIKQNYGMFGNSVKFAYFENVNWEDCYAYGTTGVTIVMGNSYTECYFKDCTIKNCYVVATGGKDTGHSGMFGSYNGDENMVGNLSSSTLTLYSYIEDNDTAMSMTYDTTLTSLTKKEQYYYTTIPSLTETELAWGSKKSQIHQDKTLSSTYPSIYENCATVDCEVYQTSDKNTNHSGVFISCIRGNVIFKNCYSNGAIYANTQAGVFTGAVIGASKGGFLYPDPDKKGSSAYVNSVFENCYTSGKIEGSEKLGGFVGMVYNDKRATNDDLLSPVGSGTYYDQGIVVFNNCYSTSSVGMESSAKYIGGFIGLLRGNVKAGEAIVIKTTITVTFSESSTKHRFINCYAAGEVGGITTDTSVSTDNKKSTNINTVGGFLGCYVPQDYGDAITTGAEISGIMTNCYYDKQTTAMRERDIGNFTDYKNDKQTSVANQGSLNGTLTGLSGLYTQSSSVKSVKGLTDTVSMNDGSAWTDKIGNYYPQLKVFSSLPEPLSENATLAEQMVYERQLQYYYDSVASTATVFLNHYDTILDADGTERTSTSADAPTYDTVRDITRKFTFTTDDSNNLVWAKNTTLNKTNNFYSKLGSGDNTGFSIDYGDIRSNAIVDSTTDNDTSLTETFDPSVLVIEKNEGEYKCLNFAPGKQWVKVTASSDNKDYADIVGSRNLRLLPTAYLNAGNIMRINIINNDNSDGTTTSQNLIYYTQGTSEIQLSGTFNHSVGVAYAITDRYRMGDSTIYGSQNATLYTSSLKETTDTTNFLFYGKYNADDSANSNLIGENSADDKDTNTITGMLSQNFKVSCGDDALQNLSYKYGSTMVRIYKASVNSKTNVLERTTEIKYTPDNIAKWQGEKLFEFNDDVNDTGLYYLDYYWRLDDGRYLTDTKLVRITASSYNVEMVTGILGEKNTVNDNESPKTAIDQYITDNVTDSTDSGSNELVWSPDFASDDKDFSESTVKSYYDDYNETLEYNDNIYYTKTIDLETNSYRTVVGWRRSTDYMLTTLIIEAIDQNGEVHQMARVDDLNSSEKNYAFEDAEYVYKYTTYSITQDTETKLFSIEAQDEIPIKFTISSSDDASFANSIEKYIMFDFTAGVSDGDGQQTTYSEIKDNLRIVALFRKNTANVTAKKEVLLKDENTADTVSLQTGSKLTPVYTTDDDGNTVATDYEYEDYEYYNALSEADSKYDVDNGTLSETDSQDDTKRKAILEGDTLTYRIKLQNTGYFESDIVNIQDTIPENCTYVEDSMAIYRQQVDLDSSGEYGALEVLASSEVSSKLCEMTEPDTDGNMTWSIASIPLDYDYYVQYKVKVDDLPDDQTSRILTNTASYDFLCRNGDTSNDFTASNLADLKANEIFTLSMDVKESEEGKQDRIYTIYFYQRDEEQEYKNIVFTDNFPEQGFNYNSEKGITIYRGSKSSGWTDVTERLETKVTLTGEGGYFTISGFSITKADEEYKVVFQGTQQDIGESYTYTDDTGASVTGTVEEISNKASVTYAEGDNRKGNSISKTERISNTVTTDETHLYINIEKQIDMYEYNATIGKTDPEQSFLMQVAYYKDATAYKNGEVSDIYYTRVNCDEAINGTDGTFSGIYKGNQLVQCDKRGIYVISEATDWSATDYDYEATTYTDVEIIDTAGNRIYSTNVSKNSAITISADGLEAEVELTRLAYESGAFPTSFGTNIMEAPTITYTNSESLYAYVSGQAYSENNISISNQ